MAYTVNKFDGTLIATVEDGTIDNTTNLRFIGKNYAGYGEIQNENFLHMLENFAGGTAPSRPVAGQMWYDSATAKLKFLSKKICLLFIFFSKKALILFFIDVIFLSNFKELKLFSLHTLSTIFMKFKTFVFFVEFNKI